MTSKRPQTSPQPQIFLSSPRVPTPRAPTTARVPVYTSLQEYSPYAHSPHRFYVLGFRAPLALFRKGNHSGLLTTKARSEGVFDSKQYLLKMLARKKKSLLADVEKTIDSARKFTREKEAISTHSQGILGVKSDIIAGRKGKKRISVPSSAKERNLTQSPMPIPEKTTLKEAYKDREWVLKAKNQVAKDWAQALRLSNGVQIQESGESYGTFTYFLGKGNNHPLVNSCFRSRGWVRLEGEDAPIEAHVVWTQGKMQDLYEYYPLVDAMNHAQVSKGISLLCTVKLQPKILTLKGKYVDISPLNYDLVTQSPSFAQLSPTLVLDPQVLETHNKLEQNEHLTDKKSLFFTLKKYCEVTEKPLFSVIPLTYHIANGQFDSEFIRFTQENAAFDDISGEIRLNGVWIVKPGENSNRGSGITVCSSYIQLLTLINTHTICPLTGQKHTFILQKYLEKPYLINKRKFDIRIYTLITSINGVIQAYFYKEGYLRTSSKEFSLRDVGNKYVHLTNDAVQKYCEEYGKFEAGNKLSYTDFQRYLDVSTPGIDLYRDLIPAIKDIIKVTIAASFLKLDPSFHQYSFELLGYDFMLDSSLKPWLIEVNTNPCLETSSPLLSRLIPTMLDNTFRIAIDPYYPENPFVSARKAAVSREGLAENLFELIFSSTVEGEEMKGRLGERMRLLM